MQPDPGFDDASRKRLMSIAAQATNTHLLLNSARIAYNQGERDLFVVLIDRIRQVEGIDAYAGPIRSWEVLSARFPSN